MREEIELSEINPDVLENIPAKIPFYTRRPGSIIKTHIDRPWQEFDYENSHSRKIEHNWGFSSGPVALTYAGFEENNYIYFMGFDLMGVGAAQSIFFQAGRGLQSDPAVATGASAKLLKHA